MAKKKESEENDNIEGGEKELPKRKTIEKKSFNINDFKKTMKIKDDDSASRPLEWLPLGPAFKEATGLEGVPLCELTLFRGYSDTSKSSLLYEVAVSAQQNGYLPVIIDTENAMKKDHLINMGFDFDGEFIYVDTDYLLNEYGKKYDKNFNAPSIEDVAEFVNNILDKQENGEIPRDIVFCYDSIGSGDCRKSLTARVKDKEASNLWNAGAMEQCFKSIFHHRIPSTRKTNKPYTSTFVAVQKIWFDSMAGGQGVVRHKLGESAYSCSRLIIHCGGVKTRGVEKVMITKNKKSVLLSTICPIKVAKNHCTSISIEGKICCTGHGLRLESEMDEYKSKYLDYFLKQLNEENDNGIEIVTIVDNTKDE